MDPAAPQPEPLPATLDSDAYCPSCGYNVRGLDGDPIRCPECGGRYARGELRWPTLPRVMSREERAGRFLKASADLCALATIPGLLALLALAAGDQIARGLVTPLAVASAITWLVGFGLFAGRCRGLPAWPRALAVYHIAGAPAMLINVVLVGIAWAVLT